MSYNYTKKSSLNFYQTLIRVTEELKKEGFGIITEIDLKEKFKEKLNVDFRNYKILGACNPKLAYQAISEEDKIGIMLPCNVVVQEHTNGEVEISTVNPMETMSSIQNEKLKPMAAEVSNKLKDILERF